MKIIRLFLVYSLLGYLSLIHANDISQRIANYTITAQLIPQTESITATETIVWHNKTSDAVSTLQFHLYMNAFQGPFTTFMREQGQSNRFGTGYVPKKWGRILINSLITAKDEDCTRMISYIRPDDGNKDDSTAIEVRLPMTVFPGDSLVIDISFTVYLPEIIARSGCQDNFYMIGQWFPKLGVYEEKKGWNCHQYHANSEFYSDFGIYDVTLVLPDDYKVGATGYCVTENIFDDSSRSVRYIARDVHDFVWAASPEFEVFSDSWDGIDIRILYQPQQKAQISRQAAAVKKTMDYCNTWYGRYPYPVLTIIDPPDAAFEAGGMEYPTLITAGFMYDLSDNFHFMEEIVVHELCHQYWYGIIANNEFEEAWLDEGFTSYSEMKIIDSLYNGTIEFSKYKFFDQDFAWSKYAFGTPKKDIIVKDSWDYPLGGYYTFSYIKPAMLLLTLENLVGKQQMRNFFGVYINRYRFRHVTTNDFIKTFCEVAGNAWQPLLNQVLYGTEVLDYRMYTITNDIISDTSGIDRYQCKVAVYREGNLVCPVAVHIVFEDGSVCDEQWDGQERYHIFTYNSTVPVSFAEIDPDFKNHLDINRINNSLWAVKQSNSRISLRNILLFWIQNFLQLMAYWV